MSAGARTVGEALRAAAARLGAGGSDTARLDAEVLLAWVLGGERTLLITRRDVALDDARAARFDALLERRLAGEPVAYLTGEKEFFSLVFAVDRRVLIPRPETEDVIEATLRALAELVAAGAGSPARRALRVLDVGTGSGVIAVTLASECRRRWPRARVLVAALDLSAAALAVARENAARHLAPGAVALLRGHLAAAFGAGTVDVLVSNPPYLSDDELAAVSTEVTREPVAALLGDGKDGAGILRELLTDAVRVLHPGGFLVSEIGSAQGKIVEALARGLGFKEVRVLPDLAGLDRVLVARWRSGPAAS